MSDDAPRSAQGNRPDQRRGRGAPAWWDMLQRSDLPDDPHAGERTVETAGWELPDTFTVPRGRRAGRGRVGTVLSLIAAVLVALAVAIAVWVATGAVGHSAGATAAVIVGVPVAIFGASLLATLAGRRRRR